MTKLSKTLEIFFEVWTYLLVIILGMETYNDYTMKSLILAQDER